MAKAKKTPSGKWRILVYDYTDANNKRHYKSFTAETKKEAEYQASEYLLTSNRGKVSYDNMTLEEAYDRYIDSKSSVLSPSTLSGYKKMKRIYFQELMHVKIGNIDSRLIQTAVNELAANHSPKTVRNAHGLLHSVIKTYAPNIDINTRLPQKIKPQYIIPTTADIQKLLAVTSPHARIPIMLAAYGGLRRSEISALTPDDFTDFGVNVNKAAVYDSDNNLKIKTTKTIAGTRFVPLPPAVIKEVLKWERFGASPALISKWFARSMEKATDIPKFSFHKLRHYFASELHAQGVPDKYIAEVGGWETVEMLQRIYQHTLRDKQDDVSKKIVSIFSKNFEPTNENATQNATQAT